MRRHLFRIPASVLTLLVFLFGGTTLFSAPEPEFSYEPVKTDTVDGFGYVALTDIARIFNATTTWHWRDKKAVLTVLGNDITLLIDSPLVMVGPSNYNLYRPTRLAHGRIMVPPALVPTAIAPLTGQEVAWEAESSRYRIPKLPATVTSVEMEVAPDETNVMLVLTEPLKYRFDRTPGGTYVLSLEEGRLATTVQTRFREVGNVKSIDLKQTPTQLVATFRPQPQANHHRVELLPDPFRLSVRFQASRYDSSAHEAIEQSIGGVLAGRDKFDVVVIDPGHGGKDPGAIGRSYRTFEKEITLKIGLNLARLLKERLGIKVILTREDDSFVPLRRRAEIANANKADLFVSIHCNSHRSRSIAGYEIYFLGHAKTDHARAVAQKENEALQFERDMGLDKDLENLGFILWDLAQNAYLEESSRVAENLNTSMSRGLTLKSRGVIQSGFTVLVGAFMPSVLVETAYLSNRNEERYLRSADGQMKTAQALLEGVRAYKQQLERRSKPVD
ncbi:N-acetylmuramoyl-L-alanine amidase [candidate division KSB1 bacterium]